MKKQNRCAPARQEQARGCGAKHTKELWRLRPVYGYGQSIAPAPQEQHTSRFAAGQIKGHTQPFRAIGRLQPNSAVVSAVRPGNKRTASTVRCPSKALESDGETQFRYAAYVLTFLKFK